MKISVALLVYNEGHTIVETLKEGYQDLLDQKLDFELWVIDNHSSDNTEKDVSALLPLYPNLRYQRHPFNLGYSLSSQSSFKIPQADYYLTVDGDGQYTLKDVTKIVTLLKAGNDVVYTIRVKRKDPLIRKIMSAVFSVVSNFLLRTGLRDLNCGFRGLSARAAKTVRIYNRVTFAGPEIFVRAKIAGFKVAQTPIQHFHRRAGHSVFMGFAGIYRSSMAMLQYVLKLRRELNGEQKPASDVPPEFEAVSLHQGK